MRWKIRVPQAADFDEIVDELERAGVHVELAHERRRIVSVSGLDRAPAELVLRLEQAGCAVVDDPQLTVEERQAEDVLGPRLVLHEPAVVRDLTEPWQPGQKRPELEGRCGLWLLVADRSTREITYDAACGHEQAFSWLCRNAWLEPHEILEQRYWTRVELERELWREQARERRAARDRATFERLLGTSG